MCCSRKNQKSTSGRRTRKLQRSSNNTESSTPPMLTPSSSRSSISSVDDHFDAINSEVLQRAGVHPPSYDSVISKEHQAKTTRAVTPDGIAPPLSIDPYIASKLNGSREDLSDADEFFEMTPRGTMRPSAEMEDATNAFVTKWKSRREEKEAEREEWKRQKKGEKKAEKAARKADKYRRKAEKWVEKAAVRESQYVY